MENMPSSAQDIPDLKNLGKDAPIDIKLGFCTGWIKYKNSWYYLDAEGKLKTEQWIDNYYVNEDGKMTKIR